MNYERHVRTKAEQEGIDRADRREFWIIAAIFAVAILAMTGLYTVINDSISPPSPATGAAEQVDQPAMPVPDGGHKPTSPGDRGGSQQVILMFGLMAVLAAGAGWVVHSSRRARRHLAETEGGAAAPPGDDHDDHAVEAEDVLSASTASPEPR